jgi:hypothetical protein
VQLVGAPDPSIILAGHSHVGALQDAVEAGQALPGVAVAMRPPIVGDGEEEMQWWNFVAQQRAGRVLVLLHWGNEHLAEFLIGRSRPVHVYGRPAIEDDGIWVSRSMIRAKYEQIYVPFSDAIAQLCEHSRGVVILGSPPPKRQAFIRATLDADWVFEPVLANNGWTAETMPLTDSEDLLQMWQVLQQVREETAIRAGATFIPAPREAIDADGFLRPEYSALDVSHANAAYGALMWRAIERELANVAAR